MVRRRENGQSERSGKLKGAVRPMILSAAVFSSVLLLSCSSFRSTAAGPSKKEGSGSVISSTTGSGGRSERGIRGVIQWGEGGGTDELMRPLAALAEKRLEQEIRLENMSGGTGSIAVQYVYDQEADGSCLLMGAENPELYDALGILDLTYRNFKCVLLIGDETTAVMVGGDSPYGSLRELCGAAGSGGEVTMAITGTGGLPWEVGAMITGITGTGFHQIQYDSDAAAREAVQNGECDFTICKLQACLPEYKEGKLKLLCMISEEANEQVPEVPAVTEEYPEFAQYLPWGPFYGIFVREGTPEDRVKQLSDAFSAAFREPEYQAVLKERGVNSRGYTGTEAEEYLSSWRINTLEALKKTGALP